MLPDALSALTLTQRPDLEAEVRSMSAGLLPEFMHHDAGANRFWDRLFTDFTDSQIVIVDGGDLAVAAGNSVPLFWDGSIEGLPGGVGDTIARAVVDLESGREPNVASALLALVSSGAQGRGLSGAVLREMKRAAGKRGLRALIAPVRPTLKHLYPLTPINRYAEWWRNDGLPFDPWLRVHARLGAEFLSIAPKSMTITGSISEWEGWTGMRFPESGSYVVPGALTPVDMNLESDMGIYEEPNVWMSHLIESGG